MKQIKLQHIKNLFQYNEEISSIKDISGKLKRKIVKTIKLLEVDVISIDETNKMLVEKHKLKELQAEHNTLSELPDSPGKSLKLQELNFRASDIKKAFDKDMAEALSEFVLVDLPEFSEEDLDLLADPLSLGCVMALELVVVGG